MSLQPYQETQQVGHYVAMQHGFMTACIERCRTTGSEQGSHLERVACVYGALGEFAQCEDTGRTPQQMSSIPELQRVPPFGHKPDCPDSRRQIRPGMWCRRCLAGCTQGCHNQ